MSISTELTRLQESRNTLRTKAVEFGIAEETALLDALATAYNGIVNQGAISAQVQEGETYTIPKGYHNGSGTVSGVAGGGNYTLQSKTVTPTTLQQSITPDSGYYGLSDVTVSPIPSNFQDVSSVTATAADVLSNKVFVTSTGAVTPGTMPNIGTVTETLNSSVTSYTIPMGYHSGEGSVNIVTEQKSTTPSEVPQTITPTSGKVLSQVTVGAIPSNYVDTTDATATAGDILAGQTAYVNGEQVVGAMVNNGAINATIDGITTTSYIVPQGYHNGSGTVSLTNDIENALAAI